MGKRWYTLVLMGFVCLGEASICQTQNNLFRDAISFEQKKRIHALEALLSMGDKGKKVVREVLKHFKKHLPNKLREATRRREFMLALRTLESELKKRREYALSWIKDPEKFKKGKGIAEMQKRVRRIKEIWKKPEVFVCQRVPYIEIILEAGFDASRYARAIEEKEYENIGTKILNKLREYINIKEMGISDSQKKWNKDVAFWNRNKAPISANEDEYKLMELINNYRLMMGFRILEMDERLIRCARDHSQEMEDLNYFSHTSPKEAHKTFVLRAKLKGYSSPICENIAVAKGPEGAFIGWFNSAGHHRNMLSSRATAMGVGRSRKGNKGMYKWTMNFGSGDSLRNKRIKDLNLIYLSKRRKVKSAEDHLKLAKWCLSVGLIKEMCFECREALKLNIHLEEARKLLANRFKYMKRLKNSK